MKTSFSFFIRFNFLYMKWGHRKQTLDKSVLAIASLKFQTKFSAKKATTRTKKKKNNELRVDKFITKAICQAKNNNKNRIFWFCFLCLLRSAFNGPSRSSKAKKRHKAHYNSEKVANGKKRRNCIRRQHRQHEQRKEQLLFKIARNKNAS